MKDSQYKKLKKKNSKILMIHLSSIGRGLENTIRHYSVCGRVLNMDNKVNTRQNIRNLFETN